MPNRLCLIGLSHIIIRKLLLKINLKYNNFFFVKANEVKANWDCLRNQFRNEFKKRKGKSGGLSVATGGTFPFLELSFIELTVTLDNTGF